MGGCSLVLSMVMYLSETLYFRSSSLTFYVIFPCVLNSKYKIRNAAPFVMSLLIIIFVCTLNHHSNHIGWPYLHPKTVATVGHACRYGGRELAAAETNWRIQTEAQQEDTVDDGCKLDGVMGATSKNFDQSSRLN